jgi:hypothetical protein
VLAGYPDGSANVNLGAEMFIPLWVGNSVLLELIKCKLLVIHCNKRVLVLSLCQYSPLDQSIQIQWVIQYANSITVRILLHLVL